jgi:hypothetical protein
MGETSLTAEVKRSRPNDGARPIPPAGDNDPLDVIDIGRRVLRRGEVVRHARLPRPRKHQIRKP